MYDFVTRIYFIISFICRYQWEQVQWPSPVHYVPPEASFFPSSPEQFMWAQGPTTPYYEYKPMVASAPVTPNVVPYHGKCIIIINCLFNEFLKIF